MLVPAAKKVGLIQDDVQPISIPTKLSTSKPYKKQKPKKHQTQAPKFLSLKPLPEHRLALPSNDPLPGGKDSLKLKELMDLCIHLSNKVLELESKVIDIKSTYKERIEKLEGRVNSCLANASSCSICAWPFNDLANAKIFDGLAKMGYEKLSETLTFFKAFFSPQWKFLIHTILQCLSAKTTSWNESGSTMTSAIICLATNQKFNFSSLKKEITKKQKIDEEAEELKSHLQIVSNDNDVYTEATPLASKIPIVDYKIHLERNKHYLKIIRADANVWRDQKGRYGLAKRYPLAHFTLEKMLNNVRLDVEEESEMSFELLRLLRRQLNEGYVPE
nr:synaptobrevin, longin-like domain protein [Tanacetum cinerariifolium]